MSLNQIHLDNRVLCGSRTPQVKQAAAAAFGATSSPQSVLAVQSSEVDLRQMVQAGRFTLHGTPSALNELPDHEKFLIKFEIPESAKPAIAQDLTYLGINISTIIPDLEHLAAHLRDTHFPNPNDKPS